MPECTQAERELLDALIEENPEQAYSYVIKKGKTHNWFDCPMCGYEALGCRTDRLKAAVLAFDEERTGSDRGVCVVTD